jgi:acetoin utilization protein AcuC
MVKAGLRVAYIDIDAHHGDGVQSAFYNTNQVLTISLHESGRYLFPGTGFETEIGHGEGKGYSVNIPLYPYTDDEAYTWAFMEIVPPLVKAFKPDVVVAQLGTDSLRTDPLAHLNLTIAGYARLVKEIVSISPKLVALGGGGYHVPNVPRCWSLAWAIMNGVDLSEGLPNGYVAKAQKYGYDEDKLYDDPYSSGSQEGQLCRREAERVVEYLKRTVFPVIVDK